MRKDRGFRANIRSYNKDCFKRFEIGYVAAQLWEEGIRRLICKILSSDAVVNIVGTNLFCKLS